MGAEIRQMGDGVFLENAFSHAICLFSSEMCLHTQMY